MEGDDYIVDPLSGIDLSQFMTTLAQKPLILHCADYDLRMLYTSFSFRPQSEVFDTMLAARLLGYSHYSLTAMAEQLLDVELTKKGQKSDWSRRPLTSEQLGYASDDTHYLEPLAEKLQVELHSLGRCDWHRQTVRNMIQLTAHEQSPCEPDAQWRIKGLRSLGRRDLAFVRQLWYWRENEAKRADIPPFKIMGNQQILELALWAASYPTDSLIDTQIVKLPRHCTGDRLEALKSAIRQAQNLPETDWPKKRKRHYRSVLSSPLIKTLRAQCSRIADELGINPAVLAPRAAMEAIAEKRPQTVSEIMACGPLMRWQAEVLESVIRHVLKEHQL